MSGVYKTLGKSTDSEAAMQDGFNEWETGGGNELSIVSEMDNDDNGPGSLVRQIRVTSPYFVTVGDISTRSDLRQIRLAFPEARLVASYVSRDLHETLFVYDDVRRGIAFEMSARSDPAAHCVAIVVHPTDKTVMEEYAPVEPYQQIGD